MHRDTASNYMRISTEYGANFHRVENLSFKALALLSSPSTPPEVCEQVGQRAAEGNTVNSDPASSQAHRLASLRY